ncbi:MAG: cytochrome c peroxidase [Alistipes sp.]|nr:cytochrome c peroxidase [Alistipes sp.]
MKNGIKLVLALLLVAVVMTVVYRLSNHVPSAELSAQMQVKTIMDDGGCLSCHSETPKLPFYANFPVVGDLVKSDAEIGYKHCDLSPMYATLENGTQVDEVTLAKMEKAIADGTMPMAKYYMVHWGSSITSPKQAVLLDWIKAQRAACFGNGMAAAAWANEPVQPIVDSLPVDPRKVALGEMLYNDPRLSADNTVACASCHGLQTGGVDNKRYSEGVGGQFGGVNAPTVFNAAFNFVQFWDGRAATLADQAGGPPLNPVEMASTSWDQIIAKLKADKAFTAAFTAVYPEGYSDKTLTGAIAEYEKTLLTPDSRFDLYLKGDSTALSTDEMQGYALFKENRCATCHVGTLLGGQSYEPMGLYGDYFADRGDSLTEEDNGRFKQTKQERDRHRFKVPGLRNVALTAPYYHDGTRETLNEAVADMARYQSNVTLSEIQLDNLTAFLGTLTGKFKGETLTTAPAPAAQN